MSHHSHRHPHSHSHGDRRFTFDKVHKLEDELRKQLQPTQPLVDALHLSLDSVVLDLGAGIGYYALPIASLLTTGKVIVADVEPRMLDRLEERAFADGLTNRIQRLPIDEHASSLIPLPPQSVDRVLVANLYHELDDRPLSLAEAKRVLRPGGQLWVMDWDPNGTTESGPPRKYRIAPDVVEAELAEAGFAGIRRHDLYPNHYVISGG